MVFQHKLFLVANMESSSMNDGEFIHYESCNDLDFHLQLVCSFRNERFYIVRSNN